MINSVTNRMSLEIDRHKKLSDAVARLRVEVSTGKKILQPSDDPVASSRVANINRSKADAAAWMFNIDVARTLTAQASGVMSNVSDGLARARDVVLAGVSTSTSPSDRATLAAELRGLAGELDSLSKTENASGRALFAETSPLVMRFSDADLFAPVPARDDIFSPGGISLSSRLDQAADALASGDVAAMNASLVSLDDAINHAANAASDIGLSAARVDDIRERTISFGIELEAERSGLEDTDLNEALSRLNQYSLTLDASRAVFARINRQSLFDFLS